MREKNIMCQFKCWETLGFRFFKQNERKIFFSVSFQYLIAVTLSIYQIVTLWQKKLDIFNQITGFVADFFFLAHLRLEILMNTLSFVRWYKARIKSFSLHSHSSFFANFHFYFGFIFFLVLFLAFFCLRFSLAMVVNNFIDEKCFKINV